MARSFDGITDRIEWASPYTRGANDPMSVSIWLTPQDTTTVRSRVTFAQSGNFSIFTPSSALTTIQFVGEFDGTNVRRNSTASLVIDDRKQHLLFTWDGSTNASNLHVYRNGSNVDDSTTTGAGSANTPSGNWAMGGRITDDTVNFEGTLAAAGVWDRILSANEIASLASGAHPWFFFNGLKFAPDLDGWGTSYDPISGNAPAFDGTLLSSSHRQIYYPAAPFSGPTPSPRDVGTVITAINSNTSEAVTVNSVSWVVDFGTITLSATVPSGVVVGDVITDSAANDYLITDINGAVLTCQDFDTTDAPATGAATIGEAYASITLWAADHDNGTNAEVYKPGDTPTGHLYGATTEAAISISGGTTVGVAGIVLTVPTAEQHDGSPGVAGASNAGLITTSTTFALIANVALPITITWVEVDLDGGNVSGFDTATGTNEQLTIGQSLWHNSAPTNNPRWGLHCDAAQTDIFDTQVFDLVTTAGSAEIRGIEGGGSRISSIDNCTVHDVTNNGSTGAATGIYSNRANASNRVRNCLVTDTGGSTSGAKNDFVVNATHTTATNLSSDGTAPSGTGDDPTTAANNYVADGIPYDLHLVNTGADAFETGTDLGTDPSGVEVDVDGYNRDTGGTTWSVGSHDGNNLRGAVGPTPYYYLHLLGA